METGPRFKVLSERPEKRGIDHAIPGLIVQLVIHSQPPLLRQGGKDWYVDWQAF